MKVSIPHRQCTTLNMYGNSVLHKWCQFLIGNVQLVPIVGAIVIANMCQFLIGNVQRANVTLESDDIVSIPHRQCTTG